MIRILRLFTVKFLLTLTIGFTLLFILACIAPILSPQKFWYVSVLGTIFPLLVFIMVALIFLWLFIKKKYALIPLIALLAGYKNIGAVFALRRPIAFENKKATNDIRILTWNVARFREMKVNNNEGSKTRLQMMELLKAQNADILCLQEFHTASRDGFYDNISYIKSNLGYPYYYFTFDKDGSELYYSSVIFSKYPIIDSGFVRYPRPALPDVLIFADIKTPGKTVRIFNTRLQSYQFKKNDYKDIEEIKNIEEGFFTRIKRIFTKFKTAIASHKTEADIASGVLINSPNPTIFCADLNDVPNSYAYRTIKDDMQDAFLEKGSGIGRTFSAISPTLRIDYIFVDKSFLVTQFKRIVKPYSDHYLQVADISIPK